MQLKIHVFFRITNLIVDLYISYRNAKWNCIFFQQQTRITKKCAV